MVSEDILQEIRRTVDPRQFLQHAKHKTFVCPYCNSGTGNKGTGMNYYEDTNTVHCWVCKKTYDVMDIYQQVYGVDFQKAVAELGHTECFEQRKAPSSLSATKEPAKDYTAYYHEHAQWNDKRAIDYLRQRGIGYETATDMGVCFDAASDPAGSGCFAPRLIIPSSKYHYVGVRVDGVDEYRKMNVKGATAEVSNLHELDKTGSVFVVEGAFDGMSIMEAGGRAVCLNSTSNVGKFLDHVKKCRPQAMLLLALDNDKAGKAATEELRKGLETEKIPYRVANLCREGKDPNDELRVDREAFIMNVQQAIDPIKAGFLQRIRAGRYKARTTGVSEFDKLTGGGLIPGQLILLGAPPGMNKTAFTQWLAETMATKDKDFRCLFFNFEMTGDFLLARSLSRIIYEKKFDDLSAFQIMQGKNIAAIEKGLETFSLIGGRVQYNPGVNGNDIAPPQLGTITKTIAKYGKIDMIVIDYLQLVDAGGSDETENIKRTMAALKHIASIRNAIVIGVMANNRQSNRTGDSSQFTGRGSSALEYGCDMLLNITDVENVPDRRAMTLAKGRLASAGSVMEFSFDGRHMRPYDLEYRTWKPVSKKEAREIDSLLDRRAVANA